MNLDKLAEATPRPTTVTRVRSGALGHIKLVMTFFDVNGLPRHGVGSDLLVGNRRLASS